jgi:PAS domain S-box-containing protein
MSAMVAVFIALHLIVYNLTHYVLEQHMMNTVQGVATATKHTIEFDIERFTEFVAAVEADPERFATAEKLQAAYEAGDRLAAYYFEMNRYLADVKEAGLLAYVYVAVIREGTIVYMLDAEPVGSENWSAPVDEDYWDESIQQIYEGESFFSGGFLSDSDWGQLIVAYAAIYDAEGNLAGFVGTDISGEYFYEYLDTIQAALFVFYIVSLLVAGLIIIHFSKRFKQAQERLMLMLDTSPVCAQIWARDLSTVDCNEAAVRLYKFKDKTEYIARFLAECSPEFQPDGQRTDEKAVALVNKAFEEGYCKFDWQHRIPDDDIVFPAEVTLVRAQYQEREVVVGYTRDLREQEQMMEAIEYRDTLMRAVNQAAVLLLDYDVDYFENALYRSMITIAEAVKVDCLYIWKNSDIDGVLHCSQLYEWSKQNTIYSNDRTLHKYDDVFPGWSETLSNGHCINGPLVGMSDEAQAFLSPGGILSILVVPIFIKDEFWGFVGFDDNNKERTFIEEEVSILNSASLLIASSFIHNDMIHGMRETADRMQRQTELTEAVNAAAMLLLTADEDEDITPLLGSSMELIGLSIKADRVHIWRNEEVDGEMQFVNIYQWCSDVGKEKAEVPENSIMTPCSMMADWRQRLKRGEYIGGSAASLSEEEKAYFDSFDVKTVIFIPLFLNEEFWGLVSIDDCINERECMEDEIAILRSVSLMMASAINRDEMIKGIQETSEKLREKDNLLQAVNKASEILLNTKATEDMSDMISTCMEYIGYSINADRIYIWQSNVADGELYHESSYSWDSEIAKEKKRVPLGTQMSFKQAAGITDWDVKFLDNDVVESKISTGSPQEQAVLNMFDIKAVTIIPMFLDEQLWGIFCIGNCDLERVHTTEEIAILRSVSLMMANAINLHVLIDKRTQELATQTAMFTTLFDSIPDLIFTKNTDGNFVHVNRALLNAFNMDIESVIGKGDANLGFDEETVRLHAESDREVMERRKTVTVEEYAPGGRLYETTKVPLIVGDEVVGALGIARDITERKVMERKLADDYEYAAKLNDTLALITNSPSISSGDLVAAAEIITVEGCHTLDVQYVGVWTLVGNSSGLESVTYYCAATAEHTIQPVYDLTLERRQRYRELLENERIITMTNLEDCKGIFDGFGIYEPTDLIAALDAPIRIDGKLVGVVCVEQEKCAKYPNGREWLIEEQNFASSLADLMALAISGHERRKARDAAERANQSKSDFIANISHEIRTPMNVIMGLTELMMDEPETTQGAKDYLEKIHASGSTLTGIINDILDISKMESGKFTLTPVNYQLASMLNDIATFNVIRIDEKPITFSLEIEEGLYSYLHGDDLRVRQILNNLLSNAFKYTKKGAVTLRVSCERENEETVKLMISVSDTGMGIRKEDAERLFKDYHQVDAQANRKIEGTGLGLSITKKLTELMGGGIELESVYGLGSMFKVEIRQGYVNDEVFSTETINNLREFRYEDKKAKTASALVRPDLSYARVLVVDDFATNLDVAKGMLGKYKMKVDCVISGQDSINAIKDATPVYDAIFMDHMMPGMDGIEAAERIRALGTDYALNIPIIALTANAAVGNEEMFLSKGFQAFLSKPINVMKLDSVVRQWIMAGEPPAAISSAPPKVVEAPASAPPPKAEEIPGINMKLGLSLYEDDMEMFIDIVKSYAENIPLEIEKLHGVNEENLGDYAINIHTVKGAFAGIGAKELNLRAKEMEAMAKAGDLAGVQAVNEQFIKDAEKLIGYIKIWLESK